MRGRGGGAEGAAVQEKAYDLRAEAPLPLLIIADRPEKIDLAKGGPVGVAEIELTIGALPEEEAGEAEFATRPDDEIRIGKIIHIEILADLFGRDLFCSLLEGAPPSGPISQELLYGIGDLLPSPVPHGDIQAEVVLGLGSLLGLCDRLLKRWGQKLQLPDRPDPDPFPVDLGVHRLLPHL